MTIPDTSTPCKGYLSICAKIPCKGRGIGLYSGMATLKITDAAARIRMNPEWLRHLVREGKIKAKRDGNHKTAPYVFDSRELDRYVKGRAK